MEVGGSLIGQGMMANAGFSLYGQPSAPSYSADDDCTMPMPAL